MIGSGQASAAEKNYAVGRRHLDFITSGEFKADGYEECHNMVFMRLGGLSRFWDGPQPADLATLMGDILCGASRHGASFAFAIVGDETGIAAYVGTVAPLADGLGAAIRSMIPGCRLSPCHENPLRGCACRCGGMITGIPTNKNTDVAHGAQIEGLCRGMLGKRFTYLVLAAGISSIAATFAHDRLMEEMAQTFRDISSSVSGGAMGNVTVQSQDYRSRHYLDNLELLKQGMEEGMSRGLWRVNAYYAADHPVDARQLGNILKSEFSGKDSAPDPVRMIPYHNISDVVRGLYMMADLVEPSNHHPLKQWSMPGTDREILLYNYQYQTILSSRQLAVLCQPPTSEFPGYCVDHYVEFDVASRTLQLQNPVLLGDVCVAGQISAAGLQNQYAVEMDDLTRHALIIGITGGGKTNTAKSLLSTLWNGGGGRKIPFLVIESAKREYWELRNLKGFEDLIVFTLGSETERSSVRYRLNPFETYPGISLQTHIDYLLATFKASFDLVAPMPYVLERAVYEVYTDKGWEIAENTNTLGLTEYPTLQDLYEKISVVAEELGYHHEVQSNIQAALEARISSLMIGGKGAMLNTPRSIPIEQLLSRPVVMELEDLGDDETKAFVIGILMVALYEYRKTKMTRGSKALSHILMIEEAHRLLKRVPDGGEASSAGKSVNFFCNMLAEIRTYGQGIVIADQIPTKLAPDTIKNTNLKIVHRTVAQVDREDMGRAMNMTPEQMEYLSSLRRGYAAVYGEGDNRPKCVKMPLVESFYDCDRKTVLEQSQAAVRALYSDYDGVPRWHAGCAFCRSRCTHRPQVEQLVENGLEYEAILQLWHAGKYTPKLLRDFLSQLTARGHASGRDQLLCVAGTILARSAEISAGRQAKIISNYLKEI